MNDHSKEEAEGTPPPVDLATARERCGQLEYECTDEAFMAKLMSPSKRPGALSKATHFFDSWKEFEEWKASEEARLDVTYIKPFSADSLFKYQEGLPLETYTLRLFSSTGDEAGSISQSTRGRPPTEKETAHA
ncbi:hypothetical protein EV714DRAFT_266394 [Schizophyllum commune]